MLHKSGAKKRGDELGANEKYNKSQKGQTHNGHRIISFCRKLFFLNYRITCRMPWHSTDAMVRLPYNWRMRSVHTLDWLAKKNKLAQSLGMSRVHSCPAADSLPRFYEARVRSAANISLFTSLRLLQLVLLDIDSCLPPSTAFISVKAFIAAASQRAPK